MNTFDRSALTADQVCIRRELAEHGVDVDLLTRPELSRTLLDIAFDYGSIVVAYAILHPLGCFGWLMIIFWFGNRQRALGNLLHDASHRNLASSKRINELLGGSLLAPTLFTSLMVYRSRHANHHAWLSSAAHDPDFIDPDRILCPTWYATYLKCLRSPSIWLGSLLGHLISPEIRVADAVKILLLWTIVVVGVALLTSPALAVGFLALWLAAKATVFHTITIYREMVDHFGLTPGGVFSFTRDLHAAKLWAWIVHPHSNGYHLTHHLLPGVPYHRLQKVHQLLHLSAEYRARARVCRSYLYGPGAVVNTWTKTGPVK